jgi:nucleoside-diphosphate-sugar epimerase
VITADLSREEIPARAFEGADVVYHFAGRAHALAERAADVEMYTRVNVEGTRRVVAAACSAGARRFVFASSVKAMGEGDGREALSPYGQSKRDAEAVVLNGDIAEPVVLRLSLVYGAGVEGNLGGMLRAVRAGWFPPPPRLDNARAMVHVDDVVRVSLAAGEVPGAAGKTLVVGDGVAYSTRAIYDAMMRALGKEPPSWSLPAPLWRSLALAGDVGGALMRRRAPFDSDAYRKLFASAWYPPSDVQAILDVPRPATLHDALPEMARAL